MKEINPYGLYNRNELAEALGVTPRTITKYYTELGLPKKKGARGNCTTGKQLLGWLENGELEESKQESGNPKLLKFRRANGM